MLWFDGGLGLRRRERKLERDEVVERWYNPYRYDDRISISPCYIEV